LHPHATPIAHGLQNSTKNLGVSKGSIVVLMTSFNDEEVSSSRLLDIACAEPDYSPDYNPAYEAEEVHYCTHGHLAGCGECSPPREVSERRSKTHAMDYIAEALRQAATRAFPRRRSPRHHAGGVLELPDDEDDGC
jgi:hypothetical protein